MAYLDENMKTMLATQLPILASVIKGGTPNIGPKRSLRLYDDKTLIFNENTGGQTLQNIFDGTKLAVAVIDRDALDGYRFVGSPEIFSKGAPFENALAFAEERGMKPPKFAVLIHLEDIFTLRPGPEAGKKVEQEA